MREIKFRAWDKVFKRMLVAGDINLPDLTCNGCPIEPHTRKNLSMEMELMQFTGLLDKNGKEIYEGDVIDCGMHEGKSEVVYLNGCFGYYRPSSFGRTFTTNCYDSLNNCEVIGNVYEHPHLLKGETNEAKRDFGVAG